MYKIADFKENLDLRKIAITKHARIRLEERHIRIDDVVTAIKNGEIIKQYIDDKPLPSCLILGKDKNNKPIHLLISKDEEFIYLITAYYPNETIWNNDFNDRRKK